MDFQPEALLTTAGLIVILLVSLSVHEFAHAATANLFGDPTAKLSGRLTLNPRAHWDRVGTTLLVVLLVINAFGIPVPIFGWGRPVPVDEGNFENPRLHGLQTALSGPMSNFVLAFLLALIIKFTGPGETVSALLVTAMFVNIFLMFFNLIPIPPLDGSRVLRLFLSERTYWSLAANPLFLFATIFVVIGYLGGYLLNLSERLVRFLLTL